MPAAVHDCVDAYQWLLQTVPSSSVIFMGDSAGGGLVFLTLQILRDAKMAMPIAGVALSPWVDLTLSSSSIDKNDGRDPVLPRHNLQIMAALAVAPAHPIASAREPVSCAATPRCSPIFGSFQHLPPLYISASSDEILYDDAVRVAEKARKAGVTVEWDAQAGLCHDYPLMVPLFPEALEAVRRIGVFVRRHFQLPANA